MRDGVPRHELLWDDEAFRARVADLATRRGLTVRQVCIMAGLSGEYLTKPAGRFGRTIEALLRIAEQLDVSLAELAGNGSAPPGELAWRLGVAADIAAHLYVALEGRQPRYLRPGSLAAAVIKTVESEIT